MSDPIPYRLVDFTPELMSEALERNAIEATVTDVDLAAAVEVFTDPDLIALLDSGDQACHPPTDIFESMSVIHDRGEHRAGITSCTFPYLEAATAELNALIANYLP